jgi:hypothetical protein
MRAGQVQPGRADKHVKPLTERVILVVNPSTRGFTRLSHQPPTLISRLEKAHALNEPELKGFRINIFPTLSQEYARGRDPCMTLPIRTQQIQDEFGRDHHFAGSA